MYQVLFFLLAGIIVGIAFHKRLWLSKVSEKLSSITIYLLLFTLGLKAGSDKMIMSQLDTLGLTALGISFFTIFGSVFTAWTMYKFVFKDLK